MDKLKEQKEELIEVGNYATSRGLVTKILDIAKKDTDEDIGRLTPILSWATRDKLVENVKVQHLQVLRLTDDARTYLSQFLIICMHAIREGKVFVDLEASMLFIDESESEVRICGYTSCQLDNNNFKTYMANIRKVLTDVMESVKEVSLKSEGVTTGAWAKPLRVSPKFIDVLDVVPRDFRHLVHCFDDFASMDCDKFIPQLITHHPSMLERGTLSSYVKSIFSGLRFDAEEILIKPISDLLKQETRNPSYKAPYSKFHLGDPYWASFDEGVRGIIEKLQSRKTFLCTSFVNYPKLHYLVFIRDCVDHLKGASYDVEDLYFAIYPLFLPLLFKIIISNRFMEGTFNNF